MLAAKRGGASIGNDYDAMQHRYNRPMMYDTFDRRGWYGRTRYNSMPAYYRGGYYDDLYDYNRGRYGGYGRYDYYPSYYNGGYYNGGYYNYPYYNGGRYYNNYYNGDRYYNNYYNGGRYYDNYYNGGRYYLNGGRSPIMNAVLDR